MDNSTVKQNKKGKNKGHKNILLNEWLFTYDEAIIAALKRPPQTTPKTILTKETETVKGGQPQQAVTSTDAPPERVSLQANTPSGAAQQVCEASDLTTGPVLRKTSWSATQPHRTSKQEQLARVWAGIVEANDYKQGPIQQKELWTPTSPKERSGRVGDNRKPHWTSSQFCQLSEALSSEAMASGDEASDFMSCLMQQKNICTAPHTTQACDEVEASSQHAMTVVPELNTLKEETQALRSSLQQASCDNKKLKDENKALRAEVKELNKAQEVTVEKVKKITDLVVQIRSKRVSEAETRRNLEQEEEALHRQKEMEVSLAQEREKNELKDQLAQTLSNLESQRLQWQEERTRLLQSLSIQNTLQEKTGSDVIDEVDDQEEPITRQQKGNTRPKKTSLWKRFLRMFA
ncbi:uncharacterized protein LOC116045431 isoform X2 [Sander lucioperca]|uniref:uncharacterized protein LOC116045431 isoform X2 n=1 Tax=Sander lucioperca TaxID=283035 RepID=UPI00125E5E6D|nr:uncharacterized protein LOC116045431 isoform X2 [Sander lucioperca]